jgi:hypothetical protein
VTVYLLPFCVLRGLLCDSSSEAMGWHTQNAAGFPGPVIRPAGPLEQTRDSAGTANLNHRIDTREIDSEIETRGRNHAALAASTTRGSCDNPKWPAHAKRSIRGGNAVSITIGLEPRTVIK